MFTSSSPEVFSKKDALQTRSKPTRDQPRRGAMSTKLFCNFFEITPTHGCARKNPQHTRRAPFSRRTPLGDCFCMSKSFKRLKLQKKLLFAVVKRNLLTLKNK